MTDETKTSTPAEELRSVLDEARTLDAKGVLDEADSTRMAELLTKGGELRAQVEQRGQLGDLTGWAGQSAGMMPLTPGGATVQTMRETSSVEVIKTPSRIGIGEIDPDGNEYSSIRSVIANPDYNKAFRQYMRTKNGMTPPIDAIRTLQEGSDGSGGFLVPEDMLDRIITKDPTPTRVAGRVTQITTGRDAITIPKVIYTTDDLYTTGMRITWTGEIPASSTAMRVTDPTFGQERIPIYTAMMSIPVTNDMVEDTDFPLISWLTGKFGETIDLLKDNMIINGNGQGQPTGILVAPGTANNPKIVLSGSAGTIGTDGTALISLAMSLPEQYDDNATFLFNKVNTGSAIAQLKDAQGRFLWGLGYQDSGIAGGFLGKNLVGYETVLSGFMPNIGAANYPIIFGDLKGYYLVNRVGLSIQVLRELYAETNQILVLGRVRFGGLTVEPWRLFAYKSNNS